MVFQIIVLLLILALVAFQSLQGLYSAMIMAICSIVAAVVAFNFADPLVTAWLAGVQPEIALPLALAVVFIVTLAVLRFIADRFLGGMVHFPYLADRIGGAILGIVPAMIIMGIFVITWQTLPLGARLITFDGFPEQTSAENPNPPRNTLWLAPDTFVVGLVNTLSAGSLGGPNRFDQKHADFNLEVAGFAQTADARFAQASVDGLEPLTIRTRDADDKHTDTQSTAPAQWVDSIAELPLDMASLAESQNPDPAPGKPLTIDGNRFLRVYLKLAPGQDDSDHAIHMTGGQAQLVSLAVDANGNRRNVPAHRSLAGWVLTSPTVPTAVRTLGVNNAWILRGPGEGKPAFTAVVFRVPENHRPWFVQFKQHSRAQVDVLGPTARVLPPQAGKAPTVTMTGLWPIRDKWQPTVSNRIPVRLMVKGNASGTASVNLAGRTVELAGNQLAEARLIARGDALANFTDGRTIEEFSPPPSCRLVMLEAEPKEIAGVFWFNLVKGVVRAGAKESRLAGVYAETDNHNWLLFYNRQLSEDAFQGIDFPKLAGTGKITRIGLVVALPNDKSQFELEIGANLKATFNLDE